MTKRDDHATLAQMCRNKPIRRFATVLPAAVSPHTGAVIPGPEEFDAGYMACFMGDLPIMPVYSGDDWGIELTAAPIAQKRGQEWRDERELQESGEIVGYWGEGQ
jgi:hypothetical protein